MLVALGGNGRETIEVKVITAALFDLLFIFISYHNQHYLQAL
jgi:hypothetical protein